MTPLVTCLCLTTTERSVRWLPQAIRNFEKQTYPNKELLIVGDGVSFWQLLPPKYPQVREIHLERGLTVGEKRNRAIASDARGQIICHWDDDDYSAPDRIMDQVQRLLESGLAATGYSSMHFTDGTSWWKYTHSDHFAIGTSLCYRRNWWEAHRFIDAQKDEDGAFEREADKHCQLFSVPAGRLMVASVHPGNTSPRSFDQAAWKPVARPARIGSPFEPVHEYAG